VTVPDTEGAPPYWPWTSILHELAAGDSTGALAAAADALTTPDQAAGAPDQLRFRVFDQVARALRTIESPALVIVDDVHRVDGGSLRLLEFLAPSLRRSRTILVLSIRTVQRHVENIYAKTGARGRAAISVFAATHGLVTPGS
jgi:hypothetical protein